MSQPVVSATSPVVYPHGEIGRLLGSAEAIVDVRSPGEFEKGGIARAVNIPLFENHERAEIGTLYKQVGRQEAISRGLNVFGEKLSAFMSQFEPYQDKNLVVYCARGGMRSKAVVSLLEAIGYRTAQLPGGYKGYRNYLLEAIDLNRPPRALVIHGQTGVGKTLLLNRLQNQLDLEGLAQHRSSVFGAINMKPRTQQWFDSLLLETLLSLDHDRPIWIEGESRKVGDVILPESLREAMGSGGYVLVTAPQELRIERIVEEYSGHDPETLAQWEVALKSLKTALGKSTVEEMVKAIHRGDFHSVVRTLLLEYYDPRYAHAMQSYSYVYQVSSEDLDSAARELTDFAERYHQENPKLASAS